MAVFEKGNAFKDIDEYNDYPLTHLYFHGKLIGKSITDNWQFRKIKHNIEQGVLSKAVLTTGYKVYNVDMVITESRDDWNETYGLEEHFTVIAKSSLEAKCKSVLKIIHKYDLNDSSNLDFQVNVFCDEHSKSDTDIQNETTTNAVECAGELI